MPRPASKKSGDSGKIPRPPNAFIIYRTYIVAHLPPPPSGTKRKQQDLSKMISELWKKEPPEVKADFKNQADVAKIDHEAKYPGYKYRPRQDKLKTMSKLQPEVEVLPITSSSSNIHNSPVGSPNTCSKSSRPKGEAGYVTTPTNSWNLAQFYDCDQDFNGIWGPYLNSHNPNLNQDIMDRVLENLTCQELLDLDPSFFPMFTNPPQ